jgi:hypothetical protein
VEDEPPAPAPPLAIEWKVAQADGDQVAVTLVVDGKPFEVGVLPAATETEPGSPSTCALRAAGATLTAITCGDLSSSIAAELRGEELVIARIDGTVRQELRRIPVYAGSLAVAAYRMPTDP